MRSRAFEALLFGLYEKQVLRITPVPSRALPMVSFSALVSDRASQGSRSEAINASGALNRPRRNSGGSTASTAANFSVGSVFRYISVVRISEWPSHNATFRTSCVACNMMRAQLCRSWCGDTDRPTREGQVSEAKRLCFSSIYSKPPRVIAVPSALTNSSGVWTRPLTASHARRSVVVCFQSGRQRSFRPFPRIRMLGERCRVRFSSNDPTSSPSDLTGAMTCDRTAVLILAW